MSLMAPTARVEQLMETLVAKIADRAGTAGITAEQLSDILAKVGTTSAEAMRQSLKPENPDHPHISAYFTEKDSAKYGPWENKPKLVGTTGEPRRTWFCGIEENAERLTPMEIESYNRITADREARSGAWTATVKYVGTKKEELHVKLPAETIDHLMNMPSGLPLILHELQTGQSTADIMDALRQIDQLKSMLVAKGSTPAELEAALLSA